MPKLYGCLDKSLDGQEVEVTGIAHPTDYPKPNIEHGSWRFLWLWVETAFSARTFVRADRVQGWQGAVQEANSNARA